MSGIHPDVDQASLEVVMADKPGMEPYPDGTGKVQEGPKPVT